MKNSITTFLLVIVTVISNISLAQEAKSEGNDIPNVENMTSEEIIKYLNNTDSLSMDQQAENYFQAYKNVDSSKVNWSVIRN